MSVARWKPFRAVAFVVAWIAVVSGPKALADDSSLMQSDGLHPTDWGSQAIALAFADQIEISPNSSSNDVHTVVCLGDSITEGYGATGYPAYLETMVDKTCVNAGIGGTTSDSGASRAAKLLSRYKPGYLCVLYGANDVNQGKSVAFTMQNLQSICDYAASCRVCPILATLTPMSGQYAGHEAAVKDLNVKIRNLAMAHGFRLADLEKEFE